MLECARKVFSSRVVSVAGLLFTMTAMMPAQSATNTVIAIGPSAQGIVQAPDGNFYAPSIKAFEACITDATMLCANIYQITPAGVMTVFHAFAPEPASSGGTAPNLDGLWPMALIVGIDGNLYGATRYAGPGGFGTIFEIPLTGPNAGKINVLASFGSSGTGLDPGASPLSLIQTSDGSFYFTNGIGVYQLVVAASGNTVIPRFTFPFDSTTQLLTQGSNADSLTEVSDGDLYMPLWIGPQTAQSNGATGAIGDLNPKTGSFRSYAFPSDLSAGSVPDGPLTEGADGQFYGVTRNHAMGPLFAFKVSTGGTITPIYSFPGTESGLAQSALILGSDDNFYGTTLEGGDTASENCTPTGCGTLFQLTPSGTLTTLHTFEGGTPTSTVVSQNPQVDGAAPEAPVVLGNDGNIYGTTFFNVVYRTTLNPPLPPPVQLTLSKTGIGINTPVTLTWQVLNAYSNTDQLCGAVVQGGATGAGNWSGVQKGTLSNGIYSGSATITPTVAGNYTYALTCGGRETGFATLQAVNGLTVTSTPLPQGQVSNFYETYLTALGGTTPFTWSVSNLPDGLLLVSATGYIYGTPTQYGNYSLNVTVTDSAEPPNQTTTVVPFNIIPGLTILTPAATIKVTQGANFLLGLAAGGGLSPYTWSIVGGQLPDGLQLIGGTGFIIGKPTALGNSTVTLQVADNETTAATKTVTLTFKVVDGVQIAAVEFTQVIQQFQYLDDLQNSLASNNEPPVPIISFKFAVMRVYFTSVDDATTVTLNAVGDVTNQTQFNIPPGCAPSDQRSHYLPKHCPSIDIYFTPPSGAWATTLTLTDENGKQLEQETLNVSSRDALSINLKGVWACTTPGDPTSCQDPSGLLGYKALAEKILPTASVTVNPTIQRVSEDVTATYLNPDGSVNKDGWIDAIVGDLNDLFTPQDILDDSTAMQRTDYTGVYNHIVANSATGVALLGAHGVLIPDIAPRLQANVEKTTEMVLAHEVGHSLSLLHTETPNPVAPGTYPNQTAPGCYGPGAGPTNWPYANNYVQDSAGYEFGFDVTAGNVIPNETFFDVMSYCVPRWITPLNYKKALLYVNPGPAAAPSVKRRLGSVAPLAEAQPKPLVTYTNGTYWSVNGTLPSGGINLHPIFTETMLGTSDQGTGTYSIQEQNASGQAIYTRNFTPVIGTTDTTGADFTTDPMFSEFIPATADTASIVIADPNGNTLINVPLVGAAPTVTITSPAAGFVGTGQQTLNWTIQSNTATSFASRIYYSVNGGATWQNIDQTKSSSDMLDFNTLPGASAALIRIDVSDGVNTGSATSVPFSVPKKVPAAIVINSPVSGAIQPAANPVYLEGGAWDADDGVLTGKALQWSDSVQGVLGTGSLLTASLEPGNHTITLTATDSDGNSITATTQIMLAGAPPDVSLTTAQVGTNCYNATITASAGNQGAALSLVNYSLDGGNTYDSIPLASLPFTFPVSGTGIVNVAAVAVDASGQVWSQSQLVNTASGCSSTQTTPTVTVTAPSSGVTTAQAIAVTVAVSGGAGNPVPTGSVTLSSGTYTSAATNLTNGSATINIPAGSLAVGGDTLTANYTPDSNSSSAYGNASGTASVMVNAAPSFALSPSGSALTVVQGSDNTDTITVSGANGFSGSVTLSASGLPSGVTASFGTNPATGSSILTLTATSSATVGGPATMTITGTSGSLTASTTIALTVNAPPTFVVGGGSSTLSIAPGATTGNTVAITVTPSNGFTGTVNLTCSVAPIATSDTPTCTLTPNSVTIAGTGSQSSTLTIFTTAATSARNQLKKLLWPAAGTSLALLALIWIPRRRRNWLTMLCVLALVVTFGAIGCGGGGGSGGGGGGGNTGTTPGTYTVTVTGTSGTITGTVGTVTLNVQ
jgi:uncharacterized repeat protein (TIGR03803 family)